MTPLRLVSPESWPWQRWCNESDFLDMFRITFVLAHTPLRIEHGNYTCSMVLCMSHELISLLWEWPGHRHRNHKSSPLDVLIIAFFQLVTSDPWGREITRAWNKVHLFRLHFGVYQHDLQSSARTFSVCLGLGLKEPLGGLSCFKVKMRFFKKTRCFIHGCFQK